MILSPETRQATIITIAFLGLVLMLSSISREEISHRVQPGDTLSSISKLYGVPIGKIARENGISSPWRIHPGDELIIPKGPASCGRSRPRFNGPSGHIGPGHNHPHNPLLCPSCPVQIPQNQVLPPIYATPSPQPPFFPAPRPQIPPFRQSPIYPPPPPQPPIRRNLPKPLIHPPRPQPRLPGPRPNQSPTKLRKKSTMHTVMPGETLMQIARRYNADIQAIIKENNIKNPNRLTQGQNLIIP